MFVVFSVGGKQYSGDIGSTFVIEKLDAEVGSKVKTGALLMSSEGADVKFSQNTSLEFEVLEQLKGPKLIIFKKRRRHTYRRKNGHRQQLTKVKLISA